MKIFCDTNVFIAAFLSDHPHYYAAQPVIEGVLAGKDQGFLAAHSLVECYSVLTRLPGVNPIAPAAAWQMISENALRNFSLIALTASEYTKTVEAAAQNGIEGGRVYDAMLLAAAAKSGAERIYTFNVRHFQNLAEEKLRSRIASP